VKNNRIVWLIIVLLLAGFLPAAGPLRADGPDLPAGLGAGSDFRISSHAGSTCTSAAIAYNDDLNEYLVVWSDTRDGSTLDIYGQLVTSAGAPKGDNFVIRDHATNSMTAPDVAYDTINQRYLVVWYALTAYSIEGRLFNSDGTAYASAFTIAAGTLANPRCFPAVACYAHAANGTYVVTYHGGASGNYNIYSRLVGVTGTVGSEKPVCTAADDQKDPDVAVDPATGIFLIVWEDGRSGTDEIYGCRQSATGFLYAEFNISPSTTSSHPRHTPAVAFNPNAGTAGEWLVAFERDVSGDSQISGRRVTAAGAATGDELIYICNDSADQRYPAVAYNANANQYLVVWHDDRNGASNLDIYGRRVDAAGVPQGSGATAICTATGNQSYPAVAASDDSTGYLVVFQDAVSPPGIQGQRVSTAGALVGSRITVAAPAQKRPAVAYNSTNTEYLVVWHDYRKGANNADVYGQRVDLDGTLLGSNFVISDADGNQLYPTVVYNSANQKYLVVWEDHRTDSDIYGQRVNAAGTLDGANFAIADSGAEHRCDPRVVFNSIRTPDEYLVVYTYEGAVSDDIRGRRVPVSGLPTVAELNIATGANDQNNPDVACRDTASGGGYLVVWRETVGAQQDIKGQRLDQDGGLLLPGVLNICNESHDQWIPRVAYSPASDRYLVVWPDDRSGAANSNIYAKQVGGDGTLYTEFAICTTTGEQAHVAAGYSAALDNYIVAWNDARSSASPDIYAQGVSAAGALVDANDPISASAGRQEYPAVAWAGAQKHGLIVWQDDRAGESNVRIYGRRLVPSYTVFLPLILKN